MSRRVRGRVPSGWSAAALGVLESRRRQLSRPSYGAHAGRVGRLLATYSAVGGEAAQPASGLVRLSALRLHVLSYGWGVGARGERRPRTLLSTYGAWCDLPGSGRVVFTRLGVRDVGRRDAVRSNPWSVGLAWVLHEHGESSRSWSSSLSVPRFYFGFRAGEPAGFDGDGEGPGRYGPGRPIGVLRALPQELFARRRVPCSCGRPGGLAGVCEAEGPSAVSALPSAVYADVSALWGRRQANPALEVLVGHGWLPRVASGVGPGVRPAVASAAAPSARGRADVGNHDDLLSHALTSLASDRALEAAVRRGLRASCEASGVALAGGAWGDEATALLCRPWEPAESPGSCGLQAIRSSSGSDPVSSSPWAWVDPVDPRHRPMPGPGSRDSEGGGSRRGGVA